jgi:FMN phosphatase YigB (HAD superfamily)
MQAIELPETVLQAWGQKAAQDFVAWLEERLHTLESPISAFVARQKVNVLVAEQVSNLLLADEPTLLQTSSKEWVWRVPVDLTFPSRGRVGRVGEVDVDARYGEVRYTDALLTRMSDEAQHLAQQVLSSATLMIFCLSLTFSSHPHQRLCDPDNTKRKTMKNQIQAILFDLDGTLLDANMDVFLPHYFKALSARVAHLLPPDQFIAHLMQASQAMVVNDGHDTNEAVFARAFYPLLGHPRQELEPIFMDFYANDFPRLRQYTRRKPQARQVVRAAFERGYDVVIATNPLFPATAIQQRLEWAGVADFAYQLVTTYENSRAAKPNLLYYEQILETIGHPAPACLVVGDEDIDMVAAHLGCPTFLVPGPRTDLASTTPEPTYRGTLADLAALLQDAR